MKISGAILWIFLGILIFNLSSVEAECVIPHNDLYINEDTTLSTPSPLNVSITKEYEGTDTIVGWCTIHVVYFGINESEESEGLVVLSPKNNLTENVTVTKANEGANVTIGNCTLYVAYFGITPGGGEVVFAPLTGTGDIDGDLVVDLIDLTYMGQAWQASEGDDNWDNWYSDADLNSDGSIDLLDLAILGQNWGNEYYY